ncbi:MAG: pyruvate kinase alpha/beta domain-containing protein [Candidatus Hodarchaeota archaeon]
MNQKLGDSKKIYCFRYCGEVNTVKALQLARTRCEELNLGKVVIASETGRSAVLALDIFTHTKIQIIVVTHYPATTWGPKGEIPIGLTRNEYSDAFSKLIENQAKIVQGTRPLAPPSRSLDWNFPTPEGLVDKTLEIFGAGTKIAIEASVMATDAGEVDEGEKIISCAGTFKGLDTVLVVKPTYSMNFFKNFEIPEIVARPEQRVKKLPEYDYKHWKGDLDKYYNV